MAFLFISLILIFGTVASLPAADSESTNVRTYTGEWQKMGTGTAFPRGNPTPFEVPVKAKDLDRQIRVSILQIGRAVGGLEDIAERIVDVEITNPNPYPVFFRGRQYKDNRTVKPIWNKLEGDRWVRAGEDRCGTGVRTWEIAPNERMKLMLYLGPGLKEQQILGRFFRVGDPSVQSECLLYEKR